MAYGTTVDALIERVRRDSLLGSRGPLYTVSVDPGINDTALEINEAPDGVGPGSLIGIDAELLYVQSVNAPLKTLTVIRAYMGSTATAHDVGTIIEVDPRFPKAALIDYAENEIKSWGQQLWRTQFAEVEVTPNQRAYNLTGADGVIYFLLDVRMAPAGTTELSSPWSSNAWPHADARLLRQSDPDPFVSTYGLQLLNHPTHAGIALVAYAQPLDVTTFDLATDLQGNVGLRPEWIEIVELGCRKRALGSSGVSRTDWRAGGMARAAEQATVFDLLRTTQMAESERQRLFADAATNLRAEWPYRRTVG